MNTALLEAFRRIGSTDPKAADALGAALSAAPYNQEDYYRGYTALTPDERELYSEMYRKITVHELEPVSIEWLRENVYQGKPGEVLSEGELRARNTLAYAVEERLKEVRGGALDILGMVTKWAAVGAGVVAALFLASLYAKRGTK